MFLAGRKQQRRWSLSLHFGHLNDWLLGHDVSKTNLASVGSCAECVLLFRVDILRHAAHGRARAHARAYACHSAHVRYDVLVVTY